VRGEATSVRRRVDDVGDRARAAAEAVDVVVAEPCQAHAVRLRQAAELGAGLRVVATATDSSSLVLQLRRTRATVAIIAAPLLPELPDVRGQLATEELTARFLLVDGPADVVELLRAVEAGIDGYVTAETSVGAIVTAARALANGRSYVPPELLGPLLRLLIEQRREASAVAQRIGRLTPREREVLRLLVEGHDRSSIAQVLVISPETARTHVQRVLHKLQVRSRAEAVALAASNGLAERMDDLVVRSAS
jgi:DNA-binding NarL/FixJ family response regulator